MVFRILAERNPSKFGHFWRFSDEIHLFLDFILQRHYLEFYQSCFAENFYGLERKFEQNSDKRRSIRRSLILAVFVPYAKLKCDRMFEKIRTEKPKSKFEKCFLAVYPYIHMTWWKCVINIVSFYWFTVLQNSWVFGLHHIAGKSPGAGSEHLTRLDRAGLSERHNVDIQRIKHKI